MSTIFVWTMTLMPALVSLVFVIGIPLTLGALLLPELRTRSYEKRRANSPFLYDATSRTSNLRSIFPRDMGTRRKAMTA